MGFSSSSKSEKQQQIPPEIVVTSASDTSWEKSITDTESPSGRRGSKDSTSGVNEKTDQG